MRSFTLALSVEIRQSVVKDFTRGLSYFIETVTHIYIFLLLSAWNVKYYTFECHMLVEERYAKLEALLKSRVT